MGKGKAEKEANDIGGKPAEGGVQYQFAIKPEIKPGWEGFKEFIWNGETSEFLGRTGVSWFKITVFYVVYYAFLTAFFIAMLLVFYQTLNDPKDDEASPTWLNSNGVIGGNPGVGYRPKPPDANIESTLITFKHAAEEDAGTWKGWVNRLDTFLQQYNTTEKDKKSKKKRGKKSDSKNQAVDCGFDILKKDDDFKPGQNQFCSVNISEAMQGECQNATNYGFPKGTPCILLKLNKIYDWEPIPYDSEDNADLPENAPKQLREYVKKWDTDFPDRIGHMVWLSCEGENPADVENVGEISYYPYPGIPAYYYPYRNQIGYKSPIVFAHLKSPKKGVLIAVECKAWAQNIKHDETKMDRVGSVHFELLID